MQLELSDEERAFRDEMREFFTTKVDEEIRSARRRGPRAHQGRRRREHADAQRGRARGAALAGRVGRPGLDRAPAPHLARGDGAGLRADAARLQRRDDRAGHRAVRHRGAEEGVPPQDRQHRHLLDPGLLRAGRRLRPGGPAHHRGQGRRRLGRQRPEDLDHARPVRRLDLHAGPHRPRREEAGRHLDAADRHGDRGPRGPADPADRRRLRGQRGLVRRRPGARREPGRRAQRRLDDRQVPARQRAGRRGAVRHHQAGPRPGQGAGRGPRSPTTRCSGPGSRSSRTSCSPSS